MSLWKLSPVDREAVHEDDPRHSLVWTYGTNIDLVVRAQSAKRAREIAAENAAHEGPEVWLDPKMTKCEPVFENGPEALIVASNTGA